MKTRKIVVFFGMLFLLCFLISGTTMTQAKQDRTVINFDYEMWVSGFPERDWLTNGGIYQARNTPHLGIVTYSESDLSGNFYYCGNVMLNVVTHDGVGGGYFDFNGLYGEGNAVGFVGKMHFKIKGGYLTGIFNCFGTGAWEGQLIKGTLEGVLGGPYIAQLIIWN